MDTRAKDSRVRFRRVHGRCDWRLLRVDCGYEDTMDERAELENLIVSSSRGNKGKKK